jgi:hypothetical protein
MDIEAWLSKFKSAWSSHEIDKVLSLFADDVEYWETPHRLLKSFEDLKKEWQGVTSQSDIQIFTSLYSSAGDRHTVIWNLRYMDASRIKQSWSGTYLITLNSDGLCVYFHHAGEKL